MGQDHSLRTSRVIAAAVLIGGLLLFFNGYGELGFYFVLFGALALWSMRHARAKAPLHADRPREIELEVISSTVPTACGQPEPGTRCSDCGGEVPESAKAFYSISDCERVCSIAFSRKASAAAFFPLAISLESLSCQSSER